MSDDVELLAFELSRDALTRQEAGLNELRARTGTLFAASSLAASFLGGRAGGQPILGGLALASFTVSAIFATYVLLPKEELVFAIHGGVILGASTLRIEDVGRQLAIWLDAYHQVNQRTMRRLAVAYRVAAGAVLAEVILWTLEVSLS